MKPHIYYRDKQWRVDFTLYSNGGTVFSKTYLAGDRLGGLKFIMALWSIDGGRHCR
jgi:hypothetical protein